MKNVFLKIIAAILLVLFVFSFAACSENDKSDDAESESKNEASAEPSATESVFTPETEPSQADETDPPETDAPETEIQNDPSDGHPEFGVIDLANNSYRNETLGIGLELDKNWTVSSTDELADMMGLSGFAEAYSKLDIVFDFAANNGNGSSISVQFENMKKNYGMSVSEEVYLGSAKTNAAQMLAAQGYSVLKADPVKLSAGGTEFNGLFFEISVYGVNVFEYSLIKKCGDYMSVITIAGLTVEEIDSILGSFYSLN